jgi:RNA polymerase sigma-70 factor (ECF subfamily)
VASSLTTHATLLERLADKDDHAAWREFEDRYGALIRSYAGRWGLQPCDCDDVLQDVLVGLTRSMPGFVYDPARGRFRSFLKTVVRRAIIKKSRQKPRASEQSVEDLPDAASEPAWEEEWRAYHLSLAMRRIEIEFNPRDRAAFEAYVVRQRGVDETADALGLSVDQVYQAKSRILRRLAEIVREQVADEG